MFFYFKKYLIQLFWVWKLIYILSFKFDGVIKIFPRYFHLFRENWIALQINFYNKKKGILVTQTHTVGRDVYVCVWTFKIYIDYYFQNYFIHLSDFKFCFIKSIILFKFIYLFIFFFNYGNTSVGNFSVSKWFKNKKFQEKLKFVKDFFLFWFVCLFFLV